MGGARDGVAARKRPAADGCGMEIEPRRDVVLIDDQAQLFSSSSAMHGFLSGMQVLRGGESWVTGKGQSGLLFR